MMDLGHCLIRDSFSLFPWIRVQEFVASSKLDGKANKSQFSNRPDFEKMKGGGGRVQSKKEKKKDQRNGFPLLARQQESQFASVFG